MDRYQMNPEDEKKLDEAREIVINALAETMDLYGVSPSNGRLYGTMYFLDEPMTLDEMAKELGMSKTSMSNTARALLDINMVEKVWQKGVRKDLYVAEKDFFKQFTQFFGRALRRELEVNMKAILKAQQIMGELASSEDAKTREIAIEDLEKVNRAKEYYQWMARFVECVENGKLYELIPKEDKKEE